MELLKISSSSKNSAGRDSGIGIALSLADFSSEVVLRFGTPEQKQTYLIPVARGDFISAGAYTEPDHGSDITLLFTTATKRGDFFVVNGTKTFITNGTLADFFVVLCQTDPNAKPPYRGQCTFLVEKGSPRALLQQRSNRRWGSA